MKRTGLLLSIFTLLVLVQCNPDNEDDLYYEPLVDGIYNISVDATQSLDFTLEPNKALTVEGQFDNGIPFSIEFEEDALHFYESVEASLMPVTSIHDMPSEFQFHFGFIFSPEGVQFDIPAKMTIELPQDIDIKEFKGFYFEGGVPDGGPDAEIYTVKLTPLLFQSEGGKKLAVFEIPHFSGFVGVSGGEFKCGNPLAADYCDELKEILACYLIGAESLTSEDRNKVNKALMDWLDAGLDYIEGHPEEMDEDWEIEEALSEILCWKATALMFNSTMAPFSEQMDRVGDLFTRSLVDKLESLNNDCMSLSDLSEKAYTFGMNGPYISLLHNLLEAGFINEDPGITVNNYCDGIASNYLLGPFLDTAQQHIRYNYGPNWTINFGGEPSPAIARSLSFKVYATNLLGEQRELILGEDFTIDIWDANYFHIEGTTIVEELITCLNEFDMPYPCYPNGGIFFIIRLATSNDAINVNAGRNMWYNK